MNVFIIPSWYPHRCFPWEGSFLVEQAEAIASTRPDWKVGLSLWGQGEGFVSTAHLLKSPRCLFDALALRPGERELEPNLVEFMTPALWWPERAFGGNRAALLDANRRNLERAIGRFGPVDILHAHVSYPAGWLAMKLSAETGIPYVLTEHMGPFPLPVYATAGSRTSCGSRSTAPPPASPWAPCSPGPSRVSACPSPSSSPISWTSDSTGARPSPTRGTSPSSRSAPWTR
jgi:hypothetical protein